MQDIHWSAAIHHDGSALYVSNLNPAIGDRVRLALRTPSHAPIERVFLRTAPDGENHLERMHEVYRDEQWGRWEVELPVHMPINPYRFKIISREGAYFYTQAGISRADAPEWNDFKVIAGYQSPAWAQDAVFYQIFPDRFYNGDPSISVQANEYSVRGFPTSQAEWGVQPARYHEAHNLDFYGGDLHGITQKLDYLQDLGVNALYLNPIFVSHTNHRYDILDFEHIDPHLGGDAGLVELRQALDAHNMKVILDITLNHCGWQHPWFTSAQADPQAETAEYFTFYQHPDNYESWLGVRSLVKLNYRSQALRDRLFSGADSILRKWQREPYRIDGWRLDVANMQGRQGAIQLGHEIGREVRQVVKQEDPHAYLLGEHFYDATTYLQGDELDATMNYSGFTIPLWRWLHARDLGSDYRPEVADAQLMAAEDMAEQWTRFRAPLPWVVARHQFNLLDSHDTERILHKVGGDRQLLRLALATLMAYPGTPCLYYGTEIGMDGGPDPDNRRCMPWDSAAWDHDLRAYCQQLIRLRRTAPALIHGGYQLLLAQGGLLSFQRESAQQRLVYVGYRGPEPLAEARIPVWQGGLRDGAVLVDLLSSATYPVKNGHIVVRDLTAGTALILDERR